MKSFNWKNYLDKYPDLKHFKTEHQAWNHFQRFGKFEGRDDRVNTFIELYDRPDRLGANITCYISQIIYAHHLGIGIKLNESKEYRYSDSPFVKYIFEWIKKHPVRGDSKIEYGNNYDFTGLMGSTTNYIKCDFVSYFKKWITSPYKIEYPVNPEKCVLVHLRLDDVSGSPDYDGSICSSFYKELLENGDYTFYTNTIGEQSGFNKQAPLSKSKIEKVLIEIKQIYPDYPIKIVTNPNEKIIDFDYPVIQSNDENYDLYLLTKAPVVVLSRSTFAISSLFFGNHERVYIPSWGHSVCMGLNTKYDNNNFIYFY